MEVGEHDVDGAEAWPGRMKIAVVPGAGRDDAVARGGGFERAHDGGADGDDGAPGGAGLGDGARGGVGDLVALGVERLASPSSSPSPSGANVPGPTCSVIVARRMPRASRAARSSGVKCRPAVGAATAPGLRANTVW